MKFRIRCIADPQPHNHGRMLGVNAPLREIFILRQNGCSACDGVIRDVTPSCAKYARYRVRTCDFLRVKQALYH